VRCAVKNMGALKKNLCGYLFLCGSHTLEPGSEYIFPSANSEPPATLLPKAYLQSIFKVRYLSRNSLNENRTVVCSYKTTPQPILYQVHCILIPCHSHKVWFSFGSNRSELDNGLDSLRSPLLEGLPVETCHTPKPPVASTTPLVAAITWRGSVLNASEPLQTARKCAKHIRDAPVAFQTAWKHARHV
jgi:hypothetical protein